MPAPPVTLALRRRLLEDWIERAIALLDEIDGDENLEPDLADTYPADKDREGDDERELDPAEDGVADLDGLAEQVPALFLGEPASLRSATEQ